MMTTNENRLQNLKPVWKESVNHQDVLDMQGNDATCASTIIQPDLI